MSDTRARVEKIRARLDHPILDSDGHDTENFPLNPRFFDGTLVAEAIAKEHRA